MQLNKLLCWIQQKPKTLIDFSYVYSPQTWCVGVCAQTPSNKHHIYVHLVRPRFNIWSHSVCSSAKPYDDSSVEGKKINDRNNITYVWSLPSSSSSWLVFNFSHRRVKIPNHLPKTFRHTQSPHELKTHDLTRSKQHPHDRNFCAIITIHSIKYVFRNIRFFCCGCSFI